MVDWSSAKPIHASLQGSFPYRCPRSVQRTTRILFFSPLCCCGPLVPYRSDVPVRSRYSDPVAHLCKALLPFAGNDIIPRPNVAITTTSPIRIAPIQRTASVIMVSPTLAFDGAFLSPPATSDPSNLILSSMMFKSKNPVYITTTML